MWIFTTIGFFSVVKKSHDAADEITIRARVRGDLEALGHHVPSMGEIRVDTDADYRYRATAKQEDFATATAQLVREIGYSNFKNEVAAAQGHDRASYYGSVWAVMYDLQLSAAVD